MSQWALNICVTGQPTHDESFLVWATFIIAFKTMSSVEHFNKWQEENYLLATIIQSGILWAIGDTLTQFLERPKKPFSSVRLLRHSVFGAFIYAPLAFLWYPGLEKHFPGMAITTVIIKVLLDQLVWTPPILCLMFLWSALTQGKTIREGFQLIRERLWKTIRVNWIVWPCVQAINLSIMPPSYRIIFINLVNVPWTAFLSLMSNRKNKNDALKARLGV